MRLGACQPSITHCREKDVYKRQVVPCAQKVVVYGVEGIGKTTFASKFPDPLFIDVEGGTKHLDVARVDPAPQSWTALMEIIREVKRTRPCACLLYTSRCV